MKYQNLSEGYLVNIKEQPTTEFIVGCCLIEWLKSMKNGPSDKSQIIFNERTYYIVRIEDCHRHGC